MTQPGHQVERLPYGGALGLVATSNLFARQGVPSTDHGARNVPIWLLIICMAVANYRATRLISKDDFPPVLWLRDRLAGGWRPLSMKEQEIVSRQPGGNQPYPMQEIDGVQNRWVTRARRSPYWLAELVSCPWCVSGWLAAALTAAVAFTVGVPAPVLVWGAVWGASALLASREWA